MKPKLYPIIPILFMAPAIILGVLTMYFNDVSSIIWLQNLTIFLIVGICSCGILIWNKFPKVNNTLVIVFSIILLLLTFIDSGVSDVHRYLSIGPVNLNIGSIVLPILLIQLEKMLQNKNWWFIAFIALTIIAILFFQPDASKVTAFSIASIFLLSKYITKHIQYTTLSVPILASVLAWVFIDNLPPVDYVEEILSMANNINTLLYMFAVISIILLPIPFFLFKTESNKLIATSLGIYFTIVLISTIFGNFPVPLLGYGLSPIIGYSIAITWLVKNAVLAKK
ncbi:hypothetical protein [Aquimarina litoralis]|uniref:hypothetical protein n=1 Tax=Aquimarina litoralis TaxID=584605 RepID=UPI001C56E2AA|nr:hypothetical protein [Aquimarina litoralis]MBW1299010.1 cell division protein [Aquimarina litoralis]